MKKRNARRALLGYIGFFIMIAVTVSAAVLIYDAARGKIGDKKSVLAIIMMLVIVVLAFACTVVDAAQRRIRIDRPVKKILEATERISKGDFTVRLEPVHSYANFNEFDIIMDNLNKMTAELQKNEALSSDFIANASHELKTPLAVICNYATVLKDRRVTDEKRAEYADILIDASVRLSALVENILKLNRLENRDTAEAETVRLDDMLAQTVLNYEKAIDDKSLELDCQIEEITLDTVASYWEIIFSNLISNAVKFTEEGGKIDIILKKDGFNTIFKIRDNGLGMDKETGERIFDKFYQGDTSHAKEGNGLGLSLVKKVIDIMGGEISVESAPGEGAEFTVVLQGA